MFVVVLPHLAPLRRNRVPQPFDLPVSKYAALVTCAAHFGGRRPGGRDDSRPGEGETRLVALLLGEAVRWPSEPQATPYCPVVPLKAVWFVDRPWAAAAGFRGRGEERKILCDGPTAAEFTSRPRFR
jgi:hypothetical protein